MTREEAIKKLQKQKAEYLDEWVDYSGIAEAFDMAIEALKAQEWTPISQKPPEDRQDCIVSTDASEMLFATFYEYSHGYNFDTWGLDCVGEITAWMPLPDPYKGESEDKE